MSTTETDDEIRGFLAQHAKNVMVPTPDVSELIAAGARSDRRRVRFVTLGAAAAVAAVVVAGTLIATDSHGPVNQGPIAPSTPTATPSASPTAGPQVKETTLERTSSSITDSDLATVDALVRNVQDPTQMNGPPFAEEVGIGMGGEFKNYVNYDGRTEATDVMYPPPSKQGEPTDLFRRLRDYLRSSPAPVLQVGTGDKEACIASEERPLVERRRRITIQPAQQGASTNVNCEDWFSISLYMDSVGVITDLIVESSDPGTVRDLVIGPKGVGSIRLGMIDGQVRATGQATSVLGDPEGGWPPGCRVLRYAPEELGSLKAINGTLSPVNGVERLLATSRMVTPQGLHLGSSIDDVRSALNRPSAKTGDRIIVEASAGYVYRFELQEVVALIALERKVVTCKAGG